MKTLLVHHRYRSSLPSGENIAVEREAELLRALPGETTSWSTSSDALRAEGLRGRLRGVCKMLGPPGRRQRLVRALRELRPDVVHAHNLWPQYGFDLHRAAHACGIPSIQTLHNYRLFATTDRFLGVRPHRPGNAGQRQLLEQMPVLHGSWLQGQLYGIVVARGWAAEWPQTAIAAWICLSRHQRDQLLSLGLPAAKTVVRPNFLPDVGVVGRGPGERAVFVGRLSAEKGILELAQLWPATGLPPLVVLGDGPLAAQLRTMPHLDVRGLQEPAEVRRTLADARFLVMNSLIFECQPLALVEALAAGTPGLVPRRGAMPEVIEDGRLGGVFTPNDPADFVREAQRLWQVAPDLRAACRDAYLAHYAMEPVGRRQTAIYANLLAGRAPGWGLP